MQNCIPSTAQTIHEALARLKRKKLHVRWNLIQAGAVDVEKKGRAWLRKGLTSPKKYQGFQLCRNADAVLAAAYHALASAAADRASHWAAMPNHQPSCFARSKLPCVAQAYYSVSNQLRLDAVTGVAMPSSGTYAKQTVENAGVVKHDTVL